GRTRRHEIGQARKERALTVDRVKPLGLGFGKTHEAHGTNLESCFLDALENLSGEATFDGIRLDYGQRPLLHRGDYNRGQLDHWRRRSTRSALHLHATCPRKGGTCVRYSFHTSQC